MSRIPLARIAQLVEPDSHNLTHPWFCPSLNRNVATDGKAMLAWDDDYRFAPRSDAHPNVVPLLKRDDSYTVHRGQSAATMSVWAEDDDAPYCAGCDTRAAWWCFGCAAPIAHHSARPGLLFGVPVSRTLLARYTRAARCLGGDVTVYAAPVQPGEIPPPVHLVAEAWTMLVMPMREDEYDGLPSFEGEAS